MLRKFTDAESGRPCFINEALVESVTANKNQFGDVVKETAQIMTRDMHVYTVQGSPGATAKHLNAKYDPATEA